MKKISFPLLLVLFSVVFLVSCTGVDYWIPPSKVPTEVPALAFRYETDLQDLFAEPTPSTIDNPDQPDEVVDQIASPEEIDNPVETGTDEGTILTQETPTTEVTLVDSSPFLYYAQAADTLPVVAVRFGVDPEEIKSQEPIPDSAYLTPGQLLVIPRRLAETTSPQHTMPDSEVVYSPSATDFDIEAFVTQAGGKLSDYKQWLESTGMTTGSGVVERVAIENSINPRLLLSLLEYQSGWVYGNPEGEEVSDYPMGYIDRFEKGLFNQLVWAVNQLSIGYYAYREGRMTEISYPDGSTIRLAPDLNAGSAALQYYFAQHYNRDQWEVAIEPVDGLPGLPGSCGHCGHNAGIAAGVL